MTSRSYDGPALDGSVQFISEAPYWQGNGETVDATDPEDPGEERAENVPVPEPRPTTSRPDIEGQSTWDDWGGESA